MNLKKIINPAPNIGGLEITDFALRFLRIENNKIQQTSLPLPPGIVSGGKIIDKQKLAAALRRLRDQIDSPKKKTHIVLVIPAVNVYSQSFTMPIVSEKHLKKTAELNLQMVSPIEIQSAYYGYKLIGETRYGQLEAVSAFAAAEIVDSFLVVLKQAGFEAAAVEFPSLSLARLVKEYGTGFNPDTPYLMINISNDGPDLMIFKNGHIHFNYFVSSLSMHNEIGGRTLTNDHFHDFFSFQVRQILNFYTNRSGLPIQEAIVVNSPIAQELISALRENFSLNVKLLTIGKYNQVAPEWYSVLGAALRGLIPRAKDTFITLTAVGVQEGYNRQIALNFVRMWRNIVIVVLGFMLLVFSAATVFLNLVSASAKKDLENRSLVPLSEVQNLHESSQKFNLLVDSALLAQSASDPWSPILEKIKSLGGQAIMVERLFIDPSMAVLLTGRAANDSSVLAFKKAVEKEPNFKEIVLPLANIKSNADGSVSFNLQFKIASLK